MTTAIRAPYRAREATDYSQPLLWAGCPWDDIGMPGGVKGVKFEERFTNFPDLTGYGSAGTAETELKYAYYFDTGCTIKQANASFGGLAMVQDGTDNDEMWVQAGGNAGGAFVFNDPINGAAGYTDPFDVWFDCRFKISTVAANVVALFMGLGEAGLAVANTKVDDTGVMVDKDWIGFQTVHGAAAENATLMFSYKEEGSTVQHKIASLATLVADTEIAVGFRHFRGQSTSKRITVFKNNVEQATGIADSDIQASTFPDGVPMLPLWGDKAGAATASTFTPIYIKAAMVKW